MQHVKHVTHALLYMRTLRTQANNGEIASKRHGVSVISTQKETGFLRETDYWCLWMSL